MVVSPRASWVMVAFVAVAAGCGSSGGTTHTDGARFDATRNPPGSPRVGAHVIAFHRQGTNSTPLTATAIDTQAAGSTIVVSIGRGMLAATAAPADDHGNSYTQLDTAHTYTLYPDSGTALYTATSASGGAGLTLTAPTPAADEITMAAVEVTDGGVIQDVQWREVLRGNPITSGRVTTTGPATLIAFWWGDADVHEDKTAVPDNGFQVIDHVLFAGALVQCSVATREVFAPGTYDVTWTATPVQGAQLWLVAVQQP